MAFREFENYLQSLMEEHSIQLTTICHNFALPDDVIQEIVSHQNSQLCIVKRELIRQRIKISKTTHRDHDTNSYTCDQPPTQQQFHYKPLCPPDDVIQSFINRDKPSLIIRQHDGEPSNWARRNRRIRHLHQSPNPSRDDGDYRVAPKEMLDWGDLMTRWTSDPLATWTLQNNHVRLIFFTLSGSLHYDCNRKNYDIFT